jgi:hypothetical protein
LRVVNDLAKLIGAGIVSLALLIAGLYVLVFDDSANPDLQKVAAGWVGVVAGYWLK